MQILNQIKNIYLGLFLIILTHVLILTKTIFFPYPELFVYPYLTNIGLIPYKQIFDQHFPGLMFLPINLNTLGMVTPDNARVWLIGVVALTQILTFITVKKISGSSIKALTACLIYLMWQPFLEGWTFWIESFLPLFYLPAFWLTLEVINSKKREKTKLIALGFFLSLGVLFKQVALPLVAFVFLLLLFYKRQLLTAGYFLMGFLPVIILTFLYFLSLGAIGDMWFWAIWFNLTTFAKYGHKGPNFSGLIRVLFILSPALLIFKLKDKKLEITLAIFIIGALAGVFDRFDLVHFQAVLPFIAIATVLVFAKLTKNTFYYLGTGVYLIVAVWWLGVFYKGHISSDVFYFDKHTLTIASKIEQSVKSGDEIYLLGVQPHLYQITKTVPAGRIFVFQFPWFMMESEGRFLAALQKTPPRLIVRDNSLVVEGRALKDYASEINFYIDQNYELFDQFEGVEFLRPKIYANNRI